MWSRWESVFKYWRIRPSGQLHVRYRSNCLQHEADGRDQWTGAAYAFHFGNRLASGTSGAIHQPLFPWSIQCGPISFLAHNALVPNRFLLCKLAAKATRALHRPGTRIHDTTNDVLERFSHSKSIADVQASHEHMVIPIRRQKAALPIRHAPIPPTSARISRVSRASSNSDNTR